jgi:hypothetical protein
VAAPGQGERRFVPGFLGGRTHPRILLAVRVGEVRAWRTQTVFEPLA